MPESEIEALWGVVQEFVRALQRRDPTVRRWIAPESDAAFLLDLYGEEALLTLLKDYLEKERFILTRAGPPPGERGPVRLVEVAWMGAEKAPPTAEDRVTLRLRRIGRRWLVEDISPAGSDRPLTVERAREIYAAQEERAGPAVMFLAGTLALPQNGCGALGDVETLLTIGMGGQPFSPREIVRALRLWRDFVRLGPPARRRPAPYAAAVHYALNLLGQHGDTQQRIADSYGVSPRGLRACFAELCRRLRLTAFDPRYSVLEELPKEREQQLAQGPAGRPLLGRRLRRC